jgi:hypothetical protein
MYWHPWHPWQKLVAASGAIAAGGLLACAAALLDLLVPTASTTAFVAMMAVLGLAIAGVVAAFTWLCGCWDDSPPEDMDRGAEDSPRWQGGPASSPEVQTALDQERRRRLRDFPPPAYGGDKYRTTLRGAEQPKPRPAVVRPGSESRAAGRRHGQ